MLAEQTLPDNQAAQFITDLTGYLALKKTKKTMRKWDFKFYRIDSILYINVFISMFHITVYGSAV